MCAKIYTCNFVSVCIMCVHVKMCSGVCVHACMCMCVYVYVHVCVCVCAQAHAGCMCVCVCTSACMLV